MNALESLMAEYVQIDLLDPTERAELVSAFSALETKLTAANLRINELERAQFVEKR